MELANLPKDHLLRNSPLIEIGARYRKKGSLVWSYVREAYNIAPKTYNELGETWIEHDVWEATRFSEDWQDGKRDRAIAQNGNVGYE